MEQDREVLRRYGIRVPDNQIDQIMKTINSNAVYKEELEKIRAKVRLPQSEEDFLQEIIKFNKDKPTTNKPVLKEGTYYIRAINPEEIESLTERAFFNSFNIEKNKPNDLASQKIVPIESDNEYGQMFKLPTATPIQEKGAEINDPAIVKTIGNVEDKTEYNCECGRHLSNEPWVECDNGDECKGSVWYHYSCAGFSQKDQVENKQFMCKNCRNAQDTQAQATVQEPPTTKRRKL